MTEKEQRQETENRTTVTPDTKVIGRGLDDNYHYCFKRQSQAQKMGRELETTKSEKEIFRNSEEKNIRTQLRTHWIDLRHVRAKERIGERADTLEVIRKPSRTNYR